MMMKMARSKEITDSNKFQQGLLYYVHEGLVMQLDGIDRGSEDANGVL